MTGCNVSNPTEVGSTTYDFALVDYHVIVSGYLTSLNMVLLFSSSVLMICSMYVVLCVCVCVFVSVRAEVCSRACL